jgi:hypothetical protein
MGEWNKRKLSIEHKKKISDSKKGKKLTPQHRDNIKIGVHIYWIYVNEALKEYQQKHPMSCDQSLIPIEKGAESVEAPSKEVSS